MRFFQFLKSPCFWRGKTGKIVPRIAGIYAYDKAKHTASLQLLCIVSGNKARLDARTEFEISQRSPKGGWKHAAVFVIGLLPQCHDLR